MSGDMNHLSEAQLHDAAESADLAHGTAAGDHLAACAECLAEVERIGRLLATVEELPRSIDPPMDLWPAIRARVNATRSAALPARPAGRDRSKDWLAAAAALLSVAAAALALFVGDEPERTAGQEGRPAANPDGAPPGTYVSDDYHQLDRAIAAQLAGQRDKLQPETIEKVERNLLIIDRAIEEIRQAMAEDPHNAALELLLRASYGQKAALVQQVSQS